MFYQMIYPYELLVESLKIAQEVAGLVRYFSDETASEYGFHTKEQYVTGNCFIVIIVFRIRILCHVLN